jgi:hypothetical protein
MLQRVREFGNSHRQLFPESSVGGQTLNVVARAVAEVEANLIAKTQVREDGKAAKLAARSAVYQRLLDIARTARGMARTNPELANTFRVPNVRSDSSLLATARAFVVEAEKVKDTLVSLNLPPTSIDELGTAADAFEQAARGRLAGRSGLTAARAGVAAAIEDGLNAVRLLDVVITNALKGDPKLAAAWKRDKKVERRPRTAPAAPDPAATPAPAAPSTPDAAPAPAVAESLPKAS